MKRFLLRTAASWIAAAVFLCTPVQAAPVLSAQRAILMDGKTGRVLYEKCAEERSLIASTTKIMTGLLIAENCDLQSMVAIPKEAIGIEGSSLYLQEGELLTVETLLYGLMLHSGNDAAVALAIYSSGSVPAFVEKMNQKAEQLGLVNTHFANPHGLDAESHYSTALDLAKLSAYALENPVFHQVVSTKDICLGGRSLTNHNKLLWRYEGAVGVKTGYTQSAGRILVSAAERSGRRLIAVTLHAPNDWKDHEALLDFGFSVFEEKELIETGAIMGEVPVISGAEATAEVIVDQSLSYPLMDGETVELRLDLPMFVYAPVLAGERAGYVRLIVDGIEQMSRPLYWRYSVMEEA